MVLLWHSYDRSTALDCSVKCMYYLCLVSLTYLFYVVYVFIPCRLCCLCILCILSIRIPAIRCIHSMFFLCILCTPCIYSVYSFDAFCVFYVFIPWIHSLCTMSPCILFILSVFSRLAFEATSQILFGVKALAHDGRLSVELRTFGLWPCVRSDTPVGRQAWWIFTSQYFDNASLARKLTDQLADQLASPLADQLTDQLAGLAWLGWGEL